MAAVSIQPLTSFCAAVVAANSELLQLHKDHQLISFTVPASPSARPSTFDLYIDYDGIYTSLSSRDFCKPPAARLRHEKN